MEKRLITHLCFVLLLVVSSSCGKKTSKKDEDFMKIIGMQNFNSEIVLSTVREGTKEEEELKIGSVIFIAITNRSREVILFPKDYGIRIFSYAEDTNKWVEIRNLADYTPDQVFKLPPKDKKHTGGTGIGLWPEFPESKQAVNVRVAVIGKITKDGTPTEKKVGAFIDVTLEP